MSASNNRSQRHDTARSRAALFNGIGSLEIRAVTDAADKEAPQRFDANLPVAMANLANLLRLGLEQSRNDSQSYRRARSEPSAM